MFVPALHIRSRSLLRGNVLVLTSLVVALILGHFPHNRATLLIILPAVVALFGTFETVRCLGLRWSIYHAGVMLCLYMDVLSLTMIFFLLLYPYMQ